MRRLKEDFSERKEEIVIYLSFLENSFDDSESKISHEPKLCKVLIANSFLLFYNLVESTVRNAIIELKAAINADGVEYEKLSEKMKLILLKDELMVSTECKKDEDKVHALLKRLLNNRISFSEKEIKFSGNLDAQKIRDIANSMGFVQPKNGRRLCEVKEKRNKLSHGSSSFNDVGRDFTIKDILSIYQNTIEFLLDFVSNIESYIENKHWIERELINDS